MVKISIFRVLIFRSKNHCNSKPKKLYYVELWFLNVTLKNSRKKRLRYCFLRNSSKKVFGSSEKNVHKRQRMYSDHASNNLIL